MKQKTYPRLKMKLWRENGETKVYYTTTHINRFYSNLRHVHYAKVYLRVEYGYDIDAFGRKEMFYNDGYYRNPRDAITALYAFMEMK